VIKCVLEKFCEVPVPVHYKTQQFEATFCISEKPFYIESPPIRKMIAFKGTVPRKSV
jgi:hypothetical protein